MSGLAKFWKIVRWFILGGLVVAIALMLMKPSRPAPELSKTEQKMFCPDIIVLEALGLFLSKTQDFSCSLCKLIKPISIVHLFVTPLSMAEDGTSPSVSFRSTRYFIIQHL